MKTLTIIISIVALGLMIFNFTKVDFNNPFEGESTVALITIVASLCVILMMAILRVSKRIEQKVKGRQ
ncbi:hypothetical protein [Thalassobellus suaedae]|uniref:DUF3955 domain-containing protein n=1 Tax=Thalassobellus suaedae TaxID=3074124 RepID=A0ABY9XSR9_9FLAO|nr:hypothetical protein RHP51_17615 [Flavobacteriaceae bacterium HL-DH14]WNH14226.1 hypothetical protein RHP49_08225 [Flavobacteriaceae bacterium HL-DH10]